PFRLASLLPSTLRADLDIRRTEEPRMTLAEKRSTKRERWGWYFYDWANSPFYSSTTTVFGALYMSTIAAADAKTNFTLNGDRPCVDAAGKADTLHNCDVTLFGLHFPAGSVWGYLLSVA